MTWLTDNGGTILKTRNAGLSWDTVWKSRFFGEAFDRIFYLNEDTGFAIHYNTLFKTTDGSKTWQQIKLSDDSYQLTNVIFTTSKTGFVTDDYCNIYTTGDGGLSWARKPLPVYYSGGITACKFINPQIGYLTAVNNYYTINSGNTYKTIDSGKTWTLQKNLGGTTITFTPDSSVVNSNLVG